MDKSTKYRQLVKNILLEYTNYNSNSNGLETQAIFDEEREHYQVVNFGWEGQKYVHYCLIHIDLKGDKIWIQWNMTEQDIAEDLVELGVSAQDIVIGFHPPKLRKLTDYAVG
ncbi:XisI protein [Crocosphaera chwakensis]|uniref:FdxN element excision controlling factor protein n=1 Tax=Crocosphaera chwakensis CCY0110 TaxID=391612 RepID=A3IV97_9CHRO|nr:XisI protein [Crocosphaera chwakensis]EAZ89566.1 fdxN element excision controlling factor protein [Crocosphaera chwakensis CCY0110]